MGIAIIVNVQFRPNVFAKFSKLKFEIPLGTPKLAYPEIC